MVALLSFFLALVEDAQAWPRRRQSNSYSGSGSVRVASKTDQSSSDYRRLAVYYSYDKALEPDATFADKIRVFLQIRDEQVLNSPEKIVAEVRLTDLTTPETTHVTWCPVSLTSTPDSEDKLGVLNVSNGKDEPLVRPARVYRLFVNLHRKSKQYGEESVIGRVPTPYYVATSGETDLERGRQRIVMRTFREWYYTERGWRRNADYPMDCHAFYRWAAGCCTRDSNYGWANLGRLFGGRYPYRNGGNIPEITREEPIHGDYVRVPGHTFMLLAYDAESDQVWTMEANFNHTIEVAIRSPNSGWTVGHLLADHIDPELLKPPAGPAAAARSVAATTDPEQAATIP